MHRLSAGDDGVPPGTGAQWPGVFADRRGKHPAPSRRLPRQTTNRPRGRSSTPGRVNGLPAIRDAHFRDRLPAWAKYLPRVRTRYETCRASYAAATLRPLTAFRRSPGELSAGRTAALNISAPRRTDAAQPDSGMRTRRYRRAIFARGGRWRSAAPVGHQRLPQPPGADPQDGIGPANGPATSRTESGPML